MFIDVHCHLDSVGNAGEKIALAKRENVSLVVSNSVDLKSMEKNLSLAGEFPEVKAALGVHPSNSLSMSNEELEKSFSFVEENIKNAVAVGETGLDFKHADSAEKKDAQTRLFKRHISLALKSKKPIIVHSRMARRECVDLLAETGAEKVLLHWFLCGEKMLKEVTGKGWLYSIGPSVLENPATQKFASIASLENMVLETDCPVPFAGVPSEPAWIPRLAQKIGELKGISPHEVELKTTETACLLFELMQKG